MPTRSLASGRQLIIGSPPAAPSGLSVAVVSVSALTPSWTDNSGGLATGFILDRATNSGFTVGLTTFTLGVVTSYADTGLTTNTTYYYRVRSFNSSGQSLNATSANNTTPRVPLAPTAGSVTVVSSSALTPHWTDGDAGNETGFHVDRALDSAFTSSLNTFTVGPSATSYADTGLASLTPYFYRVRGYNSYGEGLNSATVGGTTSASGGGTTKPLLAASDFTYLGSYPFTAYNSATYGMGLTCRRVGGQLRFLSFGYTGSVSTQGNADARLFEFALPASIGGSITSLLGTWADIWYPGGVPNVGGGDEYGLWWEDQGNGNDGVGRLWTSRCTDYPSDPSPVGAANGTATPYAIAVRNLIAGGTISNLYYTYGFYGIGQRAIYGGVQKIPQWFKDKYSVTQPYATGWGGYTSRMAQSALPGSNPSLGFMAVAIPDVTAYATNTIIPATDFKVMADHRSGTTQGDYNLATGDRGARFTTDVVNYYDQNGTAVTPPTALVSGRWVSPSPDGRGRWTWGDSYYNTGCWVEGPNKQGFIAVATVNQGNAWYQTSTLHCTTREAEIHIFDPDHFGEVLNGTRNAWRVQPADGLDISGTLRPLGLLYGHAGNSPAGGVAGACVDTTTGILYLWCPQVSGGYPCKLLAYQINW